MENLVGISRETGQTSGLAGPALAGEAGSATSLKIFPYRAVGYRRRAL